MGKYKSRIDRLRSKTQQFVSYRNLCILRDYFKAKYDEHEKTEDFERQYQEWLEIKFNCADDLEKLKRKMEENPAIIDRWLYERYAAMCKQYTKGVWLAKRNIFYLDAAKRYFRERKSQE